MMTTEFNSYHHLRWSVGLLIFCAGVSIVSRR
jgi:hypothetical protein